MACEVCRLRKVKCDRTRPRCRNCSLRSMTCVYRGERIRRTRVRNTARVTWQEDNLAHLPSALPISATDDSGNPHLDVNLHLFPTSLEQPDQTSHTEEPEPQKSPSLSPAGQLLFESLPKEDSSSMGLERSPLEWSWTDKGHEYTGPSSGTAPLSNRYLKWVQAKAIRFDHLCHIFAGLRDGVTRNLQYPKCAGQEILGNTHDFCHDGSVEALPNEDTIWRYTRAYFSRVQIIFPILDRQDFELQLANFLVNSSKSSSAWKALVFAVLASGCRAISASESVREFQNSSQEAWQYFICALQHEKMLAYEPTDLTSVKALAVMTVFAQGLSSPVKLEFTLCSTTIRLARSIGLQYAIPASQKMAETEAEERNRLFWVIYCLDKTIALRGGRPCTIDDADITCDLPSTQLCQINEQTPEFERLDHVFRCYTTFARLCGQISQALYSKNALQLRFQDLQEPAMNILVELESWRKLFVPNGPCRGPAYDGYNLSGRSQTGLLVLHFSYYYALSAVHRRFSPMFRHADEEEDTGDTLLAAASSMSHVDAAKATILLTKHLEIGSHSPCWLLVYYPLTAVLTVFTHAVSHPSRAGLEDDVILLQIAAGYFGMLEYVTSGMVGMRNVSDLIRYAGLIADDQSHSIAHNSSQQAEDPQRTNCYAADLVLSPQASAHNPAHSAIERRDNPPNALVHEMVTSTGQSVPVPNGSTQTAMDQRLLDENALFAATFDGDFFTQNPSTWSNDEYQPDISFTNARLVSNGFQQVTPINSDCP